MRALALTTLVALAPAQVFIVDASNGPGTDFTSIAAAVAAVPDGAVLLVRAGLYGGFQIAGKSLTIIGDAAVEVGGVALPPIRVVGLGASQTVVLRGLEISHQIGPAQIHGQNCAGTIVIDRCRGDNLTNPSRGGRVLAIGCDAVHVVESEFEAIAAGASAMELQSSNATVTNCDLDTLAAPAVRLAGARLDVTASQVTSRGPQEVFAMSASQLALRGATVLFGSAYVGLSAPAAMGTGTVRFDPGTLFVNTTAALFVPPITSTAVTMPWLTTLPQGAGTRIDLFGPAGGVGAIVVGFPGQPYQVPGIAERAWLLPGSEVVAAAGSATSTVIHNVPNAPWALGVTLLWQGVTFATNHGLQLSNPGA